MSRDGYRDQIVSVEIRVTPCDVGVSLHSKTQLLFMCIVHEWHMCVLSCIPVLKLVSCAFSTIPICPF